MAHFCSIVDQGPESGRLAFKVEQGVMPFCWSERALARVSTVRPRPRSACIIFGGFPRQLRHRVLDLSAYATEMRVPLLRAFLVGDPGDGCYLVDEGLLKVHVLLREGPHPGERPEFGQFKRS